MIEVAGTSKEFSSGAAIEHAVRRSQFIHAMGGPIDIEARGAVALRCDHGLRSFRDKILPELRKRHFPVAQAYNPDNWHYKENQSVTPAELNSWVQAGDVEIWNHTRNHLGVQTLSEATEQIAGALTVIAEQIPAARGQIWGFAPPSVRLGDYLGYRNGSSPSQWSSAVGQLILRHHAVASDYLPNTSLRILDGHPRVGLGHVTIERFTAAQIIEKVDEAAIRRRGLQMMIHPSQLDLPGKLSTAGFIDVLDHVTRLREADRLVVLSPYRLLLAATSSSGDQSTQWTELELGDRTVEPPSGSRARRIGDRVDINVSGIRSLRSANLLNARKLPPHLRPIFTQFTALVSDSGRVAQLRVHPDGSASLLGAKPKEIYRGNLSYVIDEPDV